ncbi:MAG: hypothetical protein AAFW70_25190 [Cyanobacteria bacterium J06635_10]
MTLTSYLFPKAKLQDITPIPNLSFGNGVVLAPDESDLLVADSLRYQIKRYWLKGEKAVPSRWKITYNVGWVVCAFHPREAKRNPTYKFSIHHSQLTTHWVRLQRGRRGRWGRGEENRFFILDCEIVS